jgi:AcrR family transcriptional regulator
MTGVDWAPWTKKRLLDQAAALFAERGATSAPVADVRRALGVHSKGTVPGFPTRAALFEAVAIRETDEIAAKLEGLKRGARDPRVAPTWMARRYRKFLDRRPYWPVLMLEVLAERSRRTEPPGLVGFFDSLDKDPLIAAHEEIRQEIEDTLVCLSTRFDLPLAYCSMISTVILWGLLGLAYERAVNPVPVDDELFEEFIAALLPWCLGGRPLHKPAPWTRVNRSQEQTS